MQLTMPLPYAGDPIATSKHAQQLESEGIGMVWVAEVYTFDAVSILGYLAATTDTLQLASGILPIYSRTPSLTGMTAAGIDAVSGGRFNLGIGVSGPQVIEGWHGVPFDRPLGRTREVVDICRKIWRREVLTADGPSYPIPLPEGEGTGLGKPLKLINYPKRSDIPIYIASLGPKNVAMTAEIAEGWMPTMFHPRKAKEVWGADLAKGLEKRDPSLGDLMTVAGGGFAVCDEPTAIELRDRIRPGLALYIGGMGAKGKNFYNNVFRQYGYEAEADEIQDLYLSGRKDEAAAAIPAEFLEQTQLIGSEGHVKEVAESYREAGVTWLQIHPVGAEAHGQVAQLAEWIK